MFFAVRFWVTLAPTAPPIRSLLAQHIVLWVDEHDCCVGRLHFVFSGICDLLNFESRAVSTLASRRSLAILDVGEKSEPEQSDDGIGDACDKPT
jgi:hypothetical protein